MSRTTRTYLYTLLALSWLLLIFAGQRLLLGRADLTDPVYGDTILRLRLTTVGVAALAGASLAVAGVLTQGLFRNPLAAPSVIGVGAGANLGGMIALAVLQLLVIGGETGVPEELVLPLGCILGALGSLLVLLGVLRFRPDTLTVLLAGIILGMFLTSLASLLQALAVDDWGLARAMLYFTMGDIANKGPIHLRVALPLFVAGTVAAWSLGRHLDILLSGEDEARSLGVDVGGTRRWAVIWIALLVAAAVSLGGNLAFVGLVVPHLLRRFTGTNHRRLLPAAILGGATFAVAADCCAAWLSHEAVLPLGIITGLVGAPVFVVVLLRHRRGGAWA